MRQQCHNSKFVNSHEKISKVLKWYNFLWVQRRLNCSPAASFANSVMTLYLLKVCLKTFLSISITKKCQTLSCDALVSNERYVHIHINYLTQWLQTHEHKISHLVAELFVHQFLNYLWDWVYVAAINIGFIFIFNQKEQINLIFSLLCTRHLTYSEYFMSY